MGYRLYELMTDMSVQVRLVRIRYPKPDNSGHTIQNYAFFAEHFDSVAARNDAELLRRGSFDIERLDARAAGIFALFQYMIGNTDWSIDDERNTALIKMQDQEQVPLPYDMDLSGLVNTHYAAPSPGLPIEDVRDRYYLGFCHSDADWEWLIEKFDAQRQTILAMADDIPGFSRQSKKSTSRFLEKFFNILDSKEKVREKIVDTCQPWSTPTAGSTAGDATQ